MDGRRSFRVPHDLRNYTSSGVWVKPAIGRGANCSRHTPCAVRYGTRSVPATTGVPVATASELCRGWVYLAEIRLSPSAPLRSTVMNRRDFLRAGTAALALPALGVHAAESSNAKPRRVGLIGSGWYGKFDLFRLIQVAPVEVVSLCDVDKRMLAEAAEIVAGRQNVEEEAADLRRLPRDAQGEGPRHRADRHARPLARPADDRGGRGRGRRLRAEADQRRRGRRPGDARRRAQAQARGAGGHAAPQHAAPDRGPRQVSSRKASSARSGWSRSTATITCGPAAIRPTPPPPDYLD